MYINELLIKSIKYPLKTNKNNYLLKYKNILVLKVDYFCNKITIKKALYKIFNIIPYKINILIYKNKKKIYKNINGYRKKYKKAYIYLKKNISNDYITNNINKVLKIN